MIMNLFRRRGIDPTIETLYGVIVAQARMPAFYADYGVPDTLEGRFDMIILHLALVIRRLRGEGERGRVASQAVFDAFCRDMDHNLREMGISDVGVPRRMRRFGEAFYGRAAAYDQGLDSEDGQELVNAVSRNVFGADAASGAQRLAQYIREAEQALARTAADDVIRGAPEFPLAEGPHLRAQESD